MYLTTQSCLHLVSNFLRLPEPDENMLYWSPVSLASVQFCESVKILRKWTNSSAWLKILRSAENCGP